MTRNCQNVPLVTYFGIRIIKPVSDLTLFTEPSQRIHCCFDDSEVKEKLASGAIIFFWSFECETTSRCQEFQTLTQFEQERWGSLVRTYLIIDAYLYKESCQGAQYCEQI